MDKFDVRFKSLITSYPDSPNDRRQFKALLHDFFPSEIREINLTLMAYDSGINKLFSNSNENRELRYMNTKNTMMRDFGSTEESAQWAISVWQYALGDTQLCVGSVPKSQIAEQYTLFSLANTAKEYFEQNGFEVIDKRENGGCLWVVGSEKELKPHIKKACEQFSLVGQYCSGGGRATGYKSAWFTKSKG